jgi:hypothetical protein
VPGGWRSIRPENVRSAAIVYAVMLPLTGLVWWLQGRDAFFAALMAGLMLTLGVAARRRAT